MLRCPDGFLGAKVGFKGSSKQLEQDLEADLGDGRIISALAKLVPDESVLGPGKFIETGDNTGLSQLGTDQIPPGIRDVGVLDAKDHGHLGMLQLGQEIDGVIAISGAFDGCVLGLVRAEGSAVDVSCEVRDACCDARIEL